MQTIYKKIDKTLIHDLPRVLFSGKLVVINGLNEAERAVMYLRRQERVGIDTETRPVFQKGRHAVVSLLQIATSDVCFLFRLNRIGMPQCLVDLLEDMSVTKVGLSLTDDFNSLRRRVSQLQPKNIVELQNEVRRLGIMDMSLQKLTANLLGYYLSKRQQLTNWEADFLTESQQIYAATDAWICIKLIERIEDLDATHDYHLI